MIGNILIGIGFLVLGLIAAGVIYELVASNVGRRKFSTPPGQLVDVNGRQLHMNRSGERQPGQPIVILEASVGANSLDWQLVQSRVAEFTQVMSYDRAGNGWSQRASSRRTPEALADDLHELLNSASIEPPYILVGHRYGGLFVRKFYEKYPEGVAGMVLVDASHPTIFDENNEGEIRRLRTNTRYFQRVGLVRLVTRNNYRAKFLDETARDQYVTMMMGDNANLLAEAEPILRDGISLPDQINVPLTIVSRKQDLDLARERTWDEHQRDLLTLNPEAKHIHTTSLNNWVIFSDPETVSQAIQEMVKAVNSG